MVVARGPEGTVAEVAGNSVALGAVGKTASRKTLGQIASRIEIAVGVVPVLGGFPQLVEIFGGRLGTHV